MTKQEMIKKLQNREEIVYGCMIKSQNDLEDAVIQNLPKRIIESKKRSNCIWTSRWSEIFDTLKMLGVEPSRWEK